jgi:hypothetical protein
VLLRQMRVDKDGNIVLPNGMRYLVLVLPTQQTMSPQVLRKIAALIDDGAWVVGERPRHAPGLANWPECDTTVKVKADSMWDAKKAKGNVRSIGDGALAWNCLPSDVLEGIVDGNWTPYDFESPNKNAGFEFIHRIIDNADFYFVANQTNEKRKGEFLFRVLNRLPELWDPVTGERRNLPEWSIDNGDRTKLTMTFEPYQSFFVVFRKPANGAIKSDKGPNFPALSQVTEIAGPWTVAFDPKWGGPQKTVFDKLEDWTQRPEDGIKYYSGTAVYKKTFDLPSSPKKGCFLDLGKVNFLARIRLNGRDLGIVWTAPWRVDVSGLLKEKGNELEIEVVNTWLNRLVGDAHLPPEKRVAKTNVQYPPTQPLMPSGLLGPVTVQKEIQ